MEAFIQLPPSIQLLLDNPILPAILLMPAIHLLPSIQILLISRIGSSGRKFRGW
jgi:hypothetical protein